MDSELTAVSGRRTPGAAGAGPSVGRGIQTWASVVVAAGIVVSTAYGLLAADPYRDLPEATVLGAQAQDVCSVLVAGLLLFLARRDPSSPRAHLLRLALLAYVAYSYAIYVIGVPMNRVFLVYVVVVVASGAALLDGLLRLRPVAWPRVGSRRLERGTGWMLVVVAGLFAGLWLSTLLPYALGGPVPDPEGVGGTPYPVFVLDLTVVLPCLAAVGVLLLRGRSIGGPLAVVALVKILTLFTALWAGVAAVVITGGTPELGPDAVPSVLMLALSAWLVVRWLRLLAPDPRTYLRPRLWEDEQSAGAVPPR